MPEAAPPPLLSVLVPTHGRGEALRCLLAALARQTLAAERFEVVVVDDGSPEAVAVDAAALPYRLVLLRQERAGPGAARNRGLECCRAPLVLILNDDAVPAADLLERHLQAHEHAPERTAVLGTFRFSQHARRSAFVRLLDESDLLFTFSQLRHGERHGWPFFWTCNLSLPTSALREVGGFDSALFPEAIVEDVELGYRLHEKGWRVLHDGRCRSEHEHVVTPHAYLRRARRLGFYLGRMHRKHQDPAVLWCPDEAHARTLRERAIDRVELHREALSKLGGALARLDEEYGQRPLPAATREQAIRLLNEVGFSAFLAGLHHEETGIDPLEVAAEGAPAGELTSVVVVSRDQLACTRRCVEALRLARDGRHPIEILVVDNGSTDGSAEWLAAQDDVQLVANPDNFGAPRARNQATERARGAWVAYLDNDVYVPPGWLGRALYHGAVDPRVGAVALVANRASKRQQVPYPGTDEAASIAAHAEERYAEYARRGDDCELFTSLAVLIRRAALDAVEGFDERLSPWGFEDDDLALRLRRAGWRNRVALDTFVYHAPYPDHAKHVRHSEHLHANWERFARKWGDGGPVPPMYDYAALGIDTRARSETAGASASAAPPAEAVSAGSGTGRDVLVLGAGRSGTSMVAGTLERAGWFVGDDPYPGRESNPKGFFETAEINGINEALLATAFPAEPLGRMQRWLSEADDCVSPEVPPHLAERMRRLAREHPFAFKDPRFCHTLPAWRAVLGEVACVCVFREPAVSAESTVRECASQDYLADLDVDFERALRVWCASYRRVLEQRRQGDWLFLHYDQLFTPEGLARLEAFLGAPVSHDFPEARLRRTTSERAVPAEAARIYAQLNALAGHDAAPITVEVAAVADPVDPPDLSVVCCSYQRRDTLARCLRSFEAQTAAGRFELVVVNDGSTDGTRELLDAWDFRVPVHVVHRENGGLSAARNSGIEVARGRLLLLVNDDTIAHPELVQAHLDTHARESRPVAVLGSFEQPPAALDNALMRVLEDDTLVFCYSQLRPGERHDWNAFWTCNVSVPADAVRAVGCFDETFRHYGCEDTDLALRLFRRGIDVLYEPRARANHDHVLDFDDLARRNRTTAKAWVRLLRKHPAAIEHEYWCERKAMTLESLERTLVEALPERPLLEASARTLARLDLGALERVGPAEARLARDAVQRLREQLAVLNRLWWAEGHAEGLREFGVASFAELVMTSPEAPWPLASEARRRVLAWPRYDAASRQLEGLLEAWAAPLAEEDTCLCLRHDESLDGPLEAVLERLQEAYAAVVEPGMSLEVLVVDDALDARALGRLGRAVEAWIEAPGESDSERAAFAAALGVPSLPAAGTSC